MYYLLPPSPFLLPPSSFPLHPSSFLLPPTPTADPGDDRNARHRGSNRQCHVRRRRPSPEARTGADMEDLPRPQRTSRQCHHGNVKEPLTYLFMTSGDAVMVVCACVPVCLCACVPVCLCACVPVWRLLVTGGQYTYFVLTKPIPSPPSPSSSPPSSPPSFSSPSGGRHPHGHGARPCVRLRSECGCDRRCINGEGYCPCLRRHDQRPHQTQQSTTAIQLPEVALSTSLTSPLLRPLAFDDHPRITA